MRKLRAMGGQAEGGAASRTAERKEILTTVAVTAIVWLVFSSWTPLLPLRWFATLVHEAGHALVATLAGADVSSVTINSHGGGLTSYRADIDMSSTRTVLIAGAGYVGAAIVGGILIEVASHLKRSRLAVVVLAALVAAIGLAWVPWTTNPDDSAAALTGSSDSDGRFTTFFCVAAVAVLAGLALQRSARLRRTALLVLATVLCLASIDDLRSVMDISSRGGHSDAAAAAQVTALSSWTWSVIWLVIGLVACGVGLWSSLNGDAD